jgi:DNA-binding PucR family transcriptional regulator
VFVIGADRSDAGARGDAALIEQERRIVDRLGEMLGTEAPGSAVSMMGRAFVVLAGERRASSLRAPDAFAGRLHDVVAAMVPETSVAVAVGDPCQAAGDFAGSFRRALEALDLMARLGRRPAVIGARALGPYRVLLRATDPAELRAFALDVLGPVLPTTEHPSTDLVDTLRALFDAGGVRRLAAERLFVHVNTVVYRLDRIERLLRRDLGDPNDAFELTLAIRILDLVGGGAR